MCTVLLPPGGYQIAVKYIISCLGCYHHPSSGVQANLSTASGICHTVIAMCRYRERVGTGLIVLWVAYATHSTIKPFAFKLSVHKNSIYKVNGI
jgi:hypothetical protein